MISIVVGLVFAAPSEPSTVPPIEVPCCAAVSSAGSEGDAPQPSPEPTLSDSDWYRPDPVDEFVRDSRHYAWEGPYHAAVLRFTPHHFFAGSAPGVGAELCLHVDVSETLGLVVGGYFPGSGWLVGVELLGNLRQPLFDLPNRHLSLGLVAPSVGLRTTVLSRPRTIALSVMLHLIGFRVVYADRLEITARSGIPTFWFTLPQFGTAFSWQTSLDVGVRF